MDRATGRNRSEIPDLDNRLKAFADDFSSFGSTSEGTLQDRALFFTAEVYASTLFQRLRAQLFEARLAMPRNDAEVFSILQSQGLLDIVESRKLRQFCELRFLSSRDPSKLDRAGIHELVSDLAWIQAILKKF